MRGDSPVRSTSQEVDDEATIPSVVVDFGGPVPQLGAVGRRKEERRHMRKLTLARGGVAFVAIAVIVGA